MGGNAACAVGVRRSGEASSAASNSTRDGAARRAARRKACRKSVTGFFLVEEVGSGAVSPETATSGVGFRIFALGWTSREPAVGAADGIGANLKTLLAFPPWPAYVIGRPTISCVPLG